MNEGVFQTDRVIFKSDIWLNIVEFRLFFYLYGNAVFNKNGIKYNNINIKRGQYLRSYRNLQKDLEYVENRAIKQYSLSRIKRAIDNLVKQKRLILEHTELGTLFTVLNYEIYQGFERFGKDNLERRENGDGTQIEQRWNNNNNDKKDKNDKNVIKYNDESIPYQAALFLRGKILEVNPNTKVPKENINSLQEWSDIIRKTLEIDKRPREELGKIIKFALEHDFWNSVIQSPKSLRKNYDKIYAQYNRNSKCKIEKNIEASKKWLEKRAENE